MTYEALNRRLATLAALFAFLGVILGVIALATQYWTVGTAITQVYNETSTTNTRIDGPVRNGLFQTCSVNFGCEARFLATTFVICLIGVLFLLAGGIFSALDIPKDSDRRFITPLLIFVGCVLITAGLFDYASVRLLNYHSSRAMIAALVFAYTALPIAAFVAGRYSVLERGVLINNEAHRGAQKYSATGSNGL